jgi:hypothetical protein
VAKDLDERFQGRSGFAVIVYNISPWDAADVDVEALYRDGEQIRDSTERVPAHEEEPFALALRPKNPSRDHDPELARVTVRYSDGQRISRYESRYTYFYNDVTHWIQESHEQITSP